MYTGLGKQKENVEKDSFAKKAAKLSIELSTKYRSASEEKQNDLNFALSLLNQSLLQHTSGNTSDADRLLGIARRIGK